MQRVREHRYTVNHARVSRCSMNVKYLLTSATAALIAMLACLIERVARTSNTGRIMVKSVVRTLPLRLSRSSQTERLKPSQRSYVVSDGVKGIYTVRQCLEGFLVLLVRHFELAMLSGSESTRVYLMSSSFES
jgi:hypothetical protein